MRHSLCHVPHLSRLIASLLLLGMTLQRSPCVSAAFRLYGVNYSVRSGPDWTTVETGRCKSYERVVEELQTLQQVVTNRVRIYTMTDCDTASIVLQASQQVGNMEVWLGLWVGADPNIFVQERARFRELLETVPVDNVLGVHVSSEAIYRGDITLQEAIALRNIVKQDLVDAGLSTLPVTIADIISTNIQYQDLIEVDDNAITFNQFTFWETTTNINAASSHMSARAALVEERAGGRQIILTETGWADAGRNDNANPANPQSMRKWLRDFICLAESRGWQYYWFTAYDEPWRRDNEDTRGDVEGHFGLFDDEMNMKPYIANLDIDCSEPAWTLDFDGTTEAPAASPSTAEPPTAVVTDAPTKAPLIESAIVPMSYPTDSPPNIENNVSSEPTQIPFRKTTTPVAISTTTPLLIPSFTPSQNVSVLSEAPSLVPVLDPSSTTPSFAPTFVRVTSSKCETNAACADMGIEQCCPTSIGQPLECCNETHTVQPGCNANPQCAGLEIIGTCCPTYDDRFLDCCSVLPDSCGAAEDACTIYSAVQYVLDQQLVTTSSAWTIAAIPVPWLLFLVVDAFIL